MIYGQLNMTDVLNISAWAIFEVNKVQSYDD